MDDENTAPRSELVAALTLLAAATLFLGSVSAADNSNKLNVQVNISEQTIIDIQPSSFAWGQGTTQVPPGSVAGPSQEQNGYGRIQIENLGSVNISQVWFNSSYPAQRPFGTGNPSNYDSANFLGMDSNNSNGDFNQFVNRKEYGLDQPNGQDIIYLDTPGAWDYGRFRNTSFEYFWTVDDVTGDGTDNLDGATFRMGVNPHTTTSTGSTALDATCATGDESGANTECNGYTLTNVTVNGQWWAYTEVEVGVQDSNPVGGGTPDDGGEYYCVVMNATQVMADGASEDPGVWFVKWNKGFPAADTGDCSYATNYTIGSDGEFQNLVPGDWVTRNIRANVPFGVVSENLPTGELFVLANSQ